MYAVNVTNIGVFELACARDIYQLKWNNVIKDRRLEMRSISVQQFHWQ